jgi:hypothetical protein
MSDADPPWQLDPELRPPAEVTLAEFCAWRQPRFGATNPARLTNSVWTWLARQPTVTGYQAAKHFGVDTMAGGPTWTNQRYGQSITPLPDGRTLAIAGEHEDSYDPDFHIYNDVIVTGADGSVEIYGYPKAAFPPTDFHSATLVGAELWLVGSVGYLHARAPRTTQVYRLDTRTLGFARVETTGASPGWIAKHDAVVSDDGRALIVRGGRCEIDLPDGRAWRRSGDDHVLDLGTGVWTRPTDRRWRQWALVRSDGRGNHLFDLRWYAQYAGDARAWAAARVAGHLERIGHLPDLAAYAARFAPPVAHEVVPTEDPDEWRTTRIAIDGVIVRYDEDGYQVAITIEGDLPDATAALIVEDARAKLAILEAIDCRARSLDPA